MMRRLVWWPFLVTAILLHGFLFLFLGLKMGEDSADFHHEVVFLGSILRQQDLLGTNIPGRRGESQVQVMDAPVRFPAVLSADYWVTKDGASKPRNHFRRDIRIAPEGFATDWVEWGVIPGAVPGVPDGVQEPLRMRWHDQDGI